MKTKPRKITTIQAGTNADYPGSQKIIVRRKINSCIDEDVKLLIAEVDGKLFFDVAVGDASVALVELDGEVLKCN